MEKVATKSDEQSLCFLLRVAELHSFRTPLRNGWTRVSVPNQGWVSVIAEPAPEKAPFTAGTSGPLLEGAQNAPCHC